MLKRTGTHGIVVLLALALIVGGLLGGCTSNAKSEARAHIDASIAAMRETAAKLGTLETVMTQFVKDAPGLKGDAYAVRHAEVAKAIDGASVPVEKMRSEAVAAKAVPDLSDKILTQAADLLIRAADSTEASLKSTRKMLDENMDSPTKFTPLFAKSTVNVGVFQALLINKQAKLASETADRLDKILK